MQPEPQCGGGCGKKVRVEGTCYHCRLKAKHARRRKRWLVGKARRAAKGKASRYIWTSGPCTWCDQQFVARGTEPARYCSDRCSSRAKKPSRGFKVTPATRLAIYERDSWTCQLCLEPVDPDLPALDNWAPSLDHIECQAWALIPDHTPRNLRLAHRWCNSKRGDETIKALFSGASS